MVSDRVKILTGMVGNVNPSSSSKFLFSTQRCRTSTRTTDWPRSPTPSSNTRMLAFGRYCRRLPSQRAQASYSWTNANNRRWRLHPRRCSGYSRVLYIPRVASHYATRSTCQRTSSAKACAFYSSEYATTIVFLRFQVERREPMLELHDSDHMASDNASRERKIATLHQAGAEASPWLLHLSRITDHKLSCQSSIFKEDCGRKSSSKA